MSPKLILKKTIETTTGFRQKKQKNKNLTLHQPYLTQKLPKKKPSRWKRNSFSSLHVGFSSLGKKKHTKTQKHHFPFPFPFKTPED